MGSDASPATPISKPPTVGMSEAQYKGQSRVSAVTANMAIAIAISASDRSN
jgi:hypothetical protein